ncbi:hypothetical protein JCM14635_16570 [Megalodesulfovibrio paquesii]
MERMKILLLGPSLLSGMQAESACNARHRMLPLLHAGDWCVTVSGQVSQGPFCRDRRCKARREVGDGRSRCTKEALQFHDDMLPQGAKKPARAGRTQPRRAAAVQWQGAYGV